MGRAILDFETAHARYTCGSTMAEVITQFTLRAEQAVNFL